MTRRTVLIDAAPARPARAALLVDGRLEDLVLDPPAGDATPSPGALYLARIDRLVPRIGAAFVRLGGAQTGFLRQSKGLVEGEAHLVQIASHAEPGKATPVTRHLMIKGALAILTPARPGINVSRRIGDKAERTRLSGAAEQALAALPAGTAPMPDTGVILRSAAAGVDAGRIAADIAGLARRWCGVLEARHSAAGPGRLAGPDPVAAALIAWAAPPPECVLARTDAPLAQQFPEAAPLFEDPDWGVGASLVADADPLHDHGVCEAIAGLRDSRVDLPSGGWMEIERTRALTAVDVNTGAEFGAGAALTANLEAARSLPRQLRLRGLGGVITIDFAPLAKPDRPRIEQALARAFEADPVETSLAGWTPLGAFEIQRKRERRPLDEVLAGA